MMTFLIIIFLSQICISGSLNILQIVPGFSHSHILFHHRLGQMLTKAGHNVTLLNMIMMPNLKTKPPPEGLLEIVVESTDYPEEISKSLTDLFQKSLFGPLTVTAFWQITINGLQLDIMQCRDLLDRNELMESLKDSHFDITLGHFFNFCPNGLSRFLKVPKYIWVGAGSFFLDHVSDVLGLPNIASYVPFYAADTSDRMSFLDRMKNFLWMFLTYLINLLPNLADYKHQTKEFQRFPDENFPDLWSIAKEDSQGIFVNGEEFLNFPRPLFHGMLHTGNLEESKEVKPLPKDWQELMDSANKGVILFSLGTVANSSLMPIKMKEAFLEAFSHFQDYLIIWRLEGEMPKGLDQQKHIRIVTWTPQKELLGHPKMRLFITHGGYNSLLETSKAAVPMIILPLFSDQYANGYKAIRHGLGLMLDKFEIDSRKIAHTIETALANDSYVLNAKKLSSFFDDKLLPNEVSTVKLIQKIARSKNWPTLKAAQRLNLLQYYCLDIIFGLMIFILICIFALVKVFVLVFRST